MKLMLELMNEFEAVPNFFYTFVKISSFIVECPYLEKSTGKMMADLKVMKLDLSLGDLKVRSWGK